MTDPSPTLSFTGMPTACAPTTAASCVPATSAAPCRSCGWVARRREHGEHLAFVDLRDHTGVVQCVVDGAVDLRSEYVVRVTGTVRARPEGTVNPSLATGEVEIGDCDGRGALDRRAAAVPASTSAPTTSTRTLRLRYRYLDLRRERMQRNLRVRATVNSAIRAAMERQGFVEVETPMLIASTPEGARDFVVPSRQQPGSFYALPQSPQLFKQLLMVGGIDRYYQIARCLRDEDLRADRQYEFMQLDARGELRRARTTCWRSSPRRCRRGRGGHRASARPTIDAHHVARGAWTASASTSPTCASAWSWSS